MTLSTQSFPKRKRGLGRVLSKLASRRNINNKKEQDSSRSVEDVKRLLVSDDASQSETSFATDWDASSSSPEYSKPLLQVGGGPTALACAMPETLLQTETENEADELLFAETPTSKEDESSSSSTSVDDAMLGMEVNVVPDQAQEQQWQLADVAVDAASIASPPMIFEDCSTSSSYSSLHHHHHHHHIHHSRSYRSYEGSAASNSIVESVDQAKVTKFTKFLKKAREQQYECASQQGLVDQPQQKHQEQRLPEVHVAMPDIIKPPKTSFSSALDKMVAFLVMICLAWALWKLQQMTPVVA